MLKKKRRKQKDQAEDAAAATTQERPADAAASADAGAALDSRDGLLLEPLLAVHGSANTGWLADSSAGAAERSLGALYAFLLLTDSTGRLVGQTPASDERLRSLVKIHQVLGIDPSTVRFAQDEKPVVGEALKSRQMAIASELADVLPLSPEEGRKAQRQLAVDKVWVTPVYWAGESLGVLLLFMPPNPPATLQLAALLGRHVAVALDNLREEEAGRKRGELDAVRWVYDERRFREELGQEVQRGRRYDRPLSILVVRMRNLGELRARYGRFLAERSLRQLANHLSEEVRNTDFLGAFEDDGFACILVESDAAGAELARNRLLNAVKSRQVFSNLPDADVQLACATASLMVDGETTEQLMRIAAERLEQDDSVQPDQAVA
jgi:diguanylate cyclase (GGDEF)-like protein